MRRRGQFLLDVTVLTDTFGVCQYPPGPGRFKRESPAGATRSGIIFFDLFFRFTQGDFFISCCFSARFPDRRAAAW